MVGYVALGLVPALLAMKIGWDLAKKKMLVSYLTYNTAGPVALTAKTEPSPHKF